MALAAVFIRDVPNQQRGMILVALGQLAIDKRRLLTIDSLRVAMIVARAMINAGAVGVHAQYFRVFLGHPRGTCTAGPPEYRERAILREAVHHAVEPAERKLPLLRFEGRPREDADGHRVAVRQLHQAHVFLQDFGLVQPLVRIVVATMEEMRTLRIDRWIALSHGTDSTDAFGPWTFRRVFNHPALLRQLIANLVRTLEILGLAGSPPLLDKLLNFGGNV